MIAFLFAGQGAQKPGMGKQLYDHSAAARAVFDTVSDALGRDMCRLCFESEPGELNLTRNAQLALYTVDLAAAAALAVFLVLPNVSPTVAYAMEDVPVLGAIVRVITLRNYDQEDEARSLHVQIPALQGAGEAGEAINEEVSAYVDALLAAFETGCEAGGVRALDVRYAVVTDAQDWFTLRVDATLAAGSSEEISRFYHIDKRSGARVQLSDLFPEGADYVTALSDEVRSQMTARAEAGEDFFPEAFDAIDANQNFYWGADGALVLVFDEYTIASGSMGMPEFSIPASMVEALQNG